MKITIVGGGPAGLYTALLLKQARPAHRITVVERNRPTDTFGWGVVFSDQTLENFRAADEPTFRAITGSFAHWDDIDVGVGDRRITSGGHGFSGIARRTLLGILQGRARELGVELQFETEVTADLDADVVIAADGVNSAIRTRHAEWFEPDLDVRPARFTWLGTTLPLDAFTFYFVENEHGVFQAHCYRFDEKLSTFIVECDEKSWISAGLDQLNVHGTIEACEKLFSHVLGGHKLMSNAAHMTASPWTRFTRVKNARWFHGNTVLVGDAAHTAHFSIGSGTKLAMEDAISLALALGEIGDDKARISEALAAYEAERMPESLRLQNAARNSMEWFEHVKRYIHLPPEQFAYSLLTRSQRVSHENLRLRDSSYVEGVERWFAASSHPERSEGSAVAAVGHPERSEGSAVAVRAAVPPMFTPFRLRSVTLENRVVLAPMDMYSATDGLPNDFHLVHLGARALGGAGLIMTEMTCPSPDARISLGCTGMYSEQHMEHWSRVTAFVHEWSRAKICLQLGHSGRKGATRLPWLPGGADAPLESNGWPTIAPSPVAYNDQLPAPRAMTRDDMDRVTHDFVRATQMAIESGFDMLELHCAHGYLLSSFLTPVSNQRTDEYGGSIENRLRYPLEVFTAMRNEWPAERPMSVRISATDWVEDGLSAEDSVAIGKAFIAAGADVIHVSTGQTASDAKPIFGRLFQTPYSDLVRNEGHLPTIAVGNITEADQVNGIIAAGRADLVAIGRPHLADPMWTLHAAAQLGYAGAAWPRQYHLGRVQLERQLEKKRTQ
ncbi:MAG: NADH:flavin oxidoreductase/NADH oxidase [Gemmatimonadetes bacterium]|nr:NADH:flavin oxidoreductase/NADH oxidase [Gemmatimonadota bacterium]